MEGELINTQEGLEGELGYKGDRGYSAYEIAVKNGYEGTEQDWIDHFGLDLTDYLKTTDVINSTDSDYTTKPLSAAKGKQLQQWVNMLYTDKADITDLANYEPKGTVLWTNSNITGEFAGQTIELDLSNYDEIDILFSSGISPGGQGWDNMQFITGRLYKINTGNNLYLGTYSATNVGIYTNGSSVTYIGVQKRIARWRSNGIVFGDGQYFESSSEHGTGNNILKPIAIIGRNVGIYNFSNNGGN